jgi:hypothetical protein
VVSCGALWLIFGSVWGIVPVCIGIHQRFCGAAFSRAKRGEIAVNCVVERGHKDGVQEAVWLLHDL